MQTLAAPYEKKLSFTEKLIKMAEVPQQALTELKQDISRLVRKIDKIDVALTGSEITQDGGLVQTVRETVTELEKLRQRVETIERKNIKTAIYVYWLWAAGGGILCTMFAYFAQLYFSHLQK